MLNIKPIRDEAFNCLESIIASVLSYFDRDYRMMFLESWGFHFLGSNQDECLCLNDKLDTGTTGISIKLLKDFYGIILKTHDSIDLMKIGVFSESELLKGYPLVINFDAFWCPWNIAFQKHHTQHCILVTGINNRNDSFYCIDPFCSSNIEEINISYVVNGFNECYTFYLEDDYGKDPDWSSLLLEQLNRLMINENGLNAFEMIKLFVEKVFAQINNKSFDFEKEIQKYDGICFIPLVVKTHEFGSDRLNFSKSLSYIMETYAVKELFGYIERLQLSGRYWREANAFIIKAFISKNTGTFEAALSRIREASVEEELAAQELLEFVKKYKGMNDQHSVNLVYQELIGKGLSKNMKLYIDTISNVYKMTYEEVNNKSNQLAYTLRRMGITPNNIVGIMTRRSFEMIIGILAIIKSGGTYLPIDPDFPESRIEYMLKDSEAIMLITQNEFKNKLAFEGAILDIYNQEFYKDDIHDLPIINKPDDLLYVIYTSGSTGLPKGVMIEHRAFCSFIKGVTDVIDFSPRSTILALTTISFDIFALETLLALAKGLTIVIADESQQRDPGLLSELIIRNNIDMLQITPSRLKLLFCSTQNVMCLKSLKTVMVGGEQLSPNILGELDKVTNAKIYNMYGPTETTVWSTIKDLTDEENVNIGKPISNTRVYIVDSDNNLAGDGQEGELCIAGDGLARGYINKPDLTNEKFVQNLFEPKGKLYRTGDLARRLPNGDIECLGRIDQQVKIRGFRIEPGEIEIQLSKINGIRDCVVVAKEDSYGDKYLAAFYICDKVLAASEINLSLKGYLPEYMIPASYIRLDSFPLTHNGKIDRKALSELKEEYAGIQSDCTHTGNEVEKIIIDIWKKVLKKDFIGINDSFFDIGGNSLLIVMMHEELENIYPGKINIGDIFAYPTVSKLAKYFIKKEHTGESLHICYLNLPVDFYSQDTRNAYRKPLRISIKEDLVNILKIISENRCVNVTDVFISLYAYLILDIAKQDKVTFYINPQSDNKFEAVSISLSGITELEELFIKTNKSINQIDSSNCFDVDFIIKKQNRSDNSLIPVICMQNSFSRDLLQTAGLVLLIEKSDSVCDILLEFDSARLNASKIEEAFLRFAKLIKAICNQAL